jgi:predicted PurR-regulated permease PerM
MSEGIEIHPVLVIVGILAGEEIAGVAGMFLALPFLAALKVVLERVRRGRAGARAAAASQ